MQSDAIDQSPGIRVMRGKKYVDCFHLVFDRHEIVTVNGCEAESLLLALMVLERLGRGMQRRLSSALGLPRHVVPPAAQPAAPIVSRKQFEQQQAAIMNGKGKWARPAALAAGAG